MRYARISTAFTAGGEGGFRGSGDKRCYTLPCPEPGSQASRTYSAASRIPGPYCNIVARMEYDDVPTYAGPLVFGQAQIFCESPCALQPGIRHCSIESLIIFAPEKTIMAVFVFILLIAVRFE